MVNSFSPSTSTLSLPAIMVQTRVCVPSAGNWNAAPAEIACVETETFLERRMVWPMETCVARSGVGRLLVMVLGRGDMRWGHTVGRAAGNGRGSVALLELPVFHVEDILFFFLGNDPADLKPSARGPGAGGGWMWRHHSAHRDSPS